MRIRFKKIIGFQAILISSLSNAEIIRTFDATLAFTSPENSLAYDSNFSTQTGSASLDNSGTLTIEIDYHAIIDVSSAWNTTINAEYRLDWIVEGTLTGNILTPSSVSSHLTNCIDHGSTGNITDMCAQSAYFEHWLTLTNPIIFSDGEGATTNIDFTSRPPEIDEFGVPTGYGSNFDVEQWGRSHLTLSAIAIPAPQTAWLFGSALIGLTGIKKRRCHAT